MIPKMMMGRMNLASLSQELVTFAGYDEKEFGTK
jgi:hypothetical protein